MTVDRFPSDQSGMYSFKSWRKRRCGAVCHAPPQAGVAPDFRPFLPMITDGCNE